MKLTLLACLDLQYNWGYPAALKNAIDYLYHEWKGKPAAIVSYGTRGGGKAAAQLQQVQMIYPWHAGSLLTSRHRFCLTGEHTQHAACSWLDQTLNNIPTGWRHKS